MKKKNKLGHLLEPSLRLYFIALVCFTVASAFFNLYLESPRRWWCSCSTATSARANNLRRREILKYIDNVTCNIDVATKDTMVNAPLPMVIFKPETDEVIWSNERFLQLTGERSTSSTPSCPPRCPISLPLAYGGQEPVPQRGADRGTGGSWCTAIWCVRTTGAARASGHHLLGGCHRVFQREGGVLRLPARGGHPAAGQL